MKIHNRKVEKCSGISNYIDGSSIKNDKVWMTEVEIYFTATYISQP